jgi:hypothetical protein
MTEDQRLWEQTVADSEARKSDTETVARAAELVARKVAEEEDRYEGGSGLPIKKEYRGLFGIGLFGL